MMPPSTTRPPPVMKAASSEARKTMPLAMSGSSTLIPKLRNDARAVESNPFRRRMVASTVSAHAAWFRELSRSAIQAYKSKASLDLNQCQVGDGRITVADKDSGLLESAERYHRDFVRLRKRVGLPVAILIGIMIGGAVLWWFWEDVAKKPGVADIVAWFERRPVLPAKPGHVTIAIAHLEDDKNREHEKLLRDALDNDFDGAETKPIDRIVTQPIPKPARWASHRPKKRRFAC